MNQFIIFWSSHRISPMKKPNTQKLTKADIKKEFPLQTQDPQNTAARASTTSTDHCKARTTTVTRHPSIDQAAPRPSMAHMFTVSRPSLAQPSNRVSVGSNQSSMSSHSGGSSGISNVSMENQVSRDGSGSTRRISSAGLPLDQSGTSGLGMRLVDCEEEDEMEESFPFTRPAKPVRTNGLSLWKIWR